MIWNKGKESNHLMIRLVAVRLARSAIVLVAVTVATFLLVYLMGDPVYALVPLDSPPDVVETTRQHFGLDRPISVSYTHLTLPTILLV